MITPWSSWASSPASFPKARHHRQHVSDLSSHCCLQLKVPLLSLDKGFQSLLELLEAHVLRGNISHTGRLGWNQHIGHDVDDTVGGNTVCDSDFGEAVDLNGDQTSVSGDVDA